MHHAVGRRLSGVVGALALLAGACGGTHGGLVAKDVLVAAIEETSRGGFTFEIEAELTPAFQDQMVGDDPSAGQVLAMASTARLVGRSDGQDTAVALELLGSSLLEVFIIGDADVYLRVGTELIPQLTGGEFEPDQVLAELGVAQLPTALADIVDAAVRGRWVGILGLRGAGAEYLGLDELEPRFGEIDPERVDAAMTRLEERFADPARFVRELTTVTEEEGVEGARRFAVAVDLHEVIRAFTSFVEDGFGQPIPESEVQQLLDEAPRQVEGLSVMIRDGLITEVELDVGVMAGPFPDAGAEFQPGAFVVDMALADHGVAQAVDAPPDAATIEVDELFELLEPFAAPTLDDAVDRRPVGGIGALRAGG